MTRDKLKLITIELFELLENSGYSYKESSKILIAIGLLISEEENEKSN